MTITFSPDQQAALDAMLSAILGGAQEAQLTGKAGTGKTTITKEMIARIEATGRRVVVAAPTWRAAKVLSAAIGRPVASVHSCLYGHVFEKEDKATGDTHICFGNRHAPCGVGEVFLVDEASMLHQSVYDDLLSVMPEGSCLVLVGDTRQLPPPKGSIVPCLFQPTASLETIHRQAAGSPIISLADAIDQGGRRWTWQSAPRWVWEGPDVKLLPAGSFAPEAVLAKRVAAGADIVLLTYRNEDIDRVNHLVREKLGRGGAPLAAGDRILFCEKAQDIGAVRNEFARVVDVEEATPMMMRHRDLQICRLELEDGRVEEVSVYTKSLARGESLRRDATVLIERWLSGAKLPPLVQARYAYAASVHRAQGSQFPEVVYWETYASRRSLECRALRYTGVTRSSRRLAVSA